MNKKNRLIFAAFLAAAALLRCFQMLTGFDAAGLPEPSGLPGLLLPVVLLAAAVFFFLAARQLPGRRLLTDEMRSYFRFPDMPAVLCSVAGSFAVLAGGALTLLRSGGTAMILLLGVFACAAALCVLLSVFSLYRGENPQGVLLLVPVCALAVYLVFLYRVDAANPILAEIYIEILAVAALTYSSLERAAFAFRNGSPRVFLWSSAMAAILSACAAAELRSLAASLIFLGFALVEAGFLLAADLKP